MTQFILTPRAAQDVNDIWGYIAGHDLAAADRVLDALHNAILKQGTHESDTGVRIWRISDTASSWCIPT
jgi:plasmid stabilization system protein ParE